MFIVPQNEGFRVSGGATEFGKGRNKAAQTAIGNIILLGSTIRASMTGCMVMKIGVLQQRRE